MKELESFLNYQRSEITKKDYKKSIEEFLEYKNIKTFKEFEVLTIDDYVDYRSYLLNKVNNSESTVNTKLRALSSFYNYLQNEKDIKLTNYAKGVANKLKPQAKKRTYLTSTEATNLLNMCKNKREYAIIMLLLNNGLRVSELINAKIEDYNSIKSTLIIIGKGGLKYTIPLSPLVADSINEYLKIRKESKCNNLFISNGGKPMQVNSIDRTIKKLAQRANINKSVSAHPLRRTLATDLHKTGCDIKEIQSVLRH